MKMNVGGSAPDPPRFSALVSGRTIATAGFRKKKGQLDAVLPPTRQGAQVAPQRCLILPVGKATLL